ncbi:class I SAM-dependent DNA methyltransferase [Vibrio mytili]|uniref:type I restriction-modification system subunit M n=1 Tax=Vibrio mytili TaxID=50718 RepID=UPI002F403F00
MAKKTPVAKNTISIEDSLWESANRLRGNIQSSEYKHVVLSLIFLKFISDKFEQRRVKIEEEFGSDFIDEPDFYKMENVFFLPENARWSHIVKHAKQDGLAIKIDSVMSAVEKSDKSLAGTLPDNYFSRLEIDSARLASLVDTINNIDTIASECELSEEDLVGRVYEYFLGKFAASEGQRGGEFYTPKCVVTLLTEMLEPFQGNIYDPCCGSGGMFVQSLKFIQAHQGSKNNVAIHGQEFTSTTRKLAKMNLAIRGINGNLGEESADTFFKDQHPDLKADYIMANPPFNQSKWRGDAELTDDPRWADYDTPPVGNANYAWVMHMISKLSNKGTAGFVLANGSMSSTTSGEGKIREKIINDDLVECMIALPGQLFYTTQIPVCLWFLTRNKQANKAKDYRDRRGETLFIDARNMGSLIEGSRKQKELSIEEIQEIARTFHAWRGEKKDGEYQDQAGFCKSATLEEIAKHDFVLTPGRYVGAAEEEDDGVPFAEKMATLTTKLSEQFAESATLEAEIKKNLAGLGYEI